MICAQRPDDPGFFTSCNAVLRGPCACGVQVAEELAGEGGAS